MSVVEPSAIPSGEALLAGFDYQPRTRVIFGARSIDQAGSLVKSWHVQRVLLVTDPGLIAAGHAAHVEKILQASGLDVVQFGEVRENPTTECVDRCLEVAQAGNIQAFVGLGGGSSMDTAKGCNFLLTNGGQMKDYWGVGKATKPMLPLLAVPTTAGTGSECQSFALIAEAKSHLKMACGDPKAAARVAILDPELTISQPPRVTACTGVDAITHALESAVTRKRNALSLLYSREALKLCGGNLRRVLANPQDLDARGAMLLGAALAGVAIENSMLGAAHSAANPLTAHFDVVHGHAVGIMMPHVVRFNARVPWVAEAYAELAGGLGVPFLNLGTEHSLAMFLSRIDTLLNAAQIPRSLTEFGVTEADLPRLAEEAAAQWTANFNPRPAVKKDFVALYEAAMEPRGDGDSTWLL